MRTGCSPNSGQGLNEAQINAALVNREVRVAAAHPFAWLMTYVERVGDLFSLEPAWELPKTCGLAL